VERIRYRKEKEGDGIGGMNPLLRNPA